MDPKTAITVATIAFLGVLIGGLITAGANFILAVRKERADDRRDRETRQRELRRAARLVGQELLAARVCSTWVTQNRQWVDEQLRTEAWIAYRHILAPELSREAWDEITYSYEAIELFNRSVQRRTDEVPDNVSLAFLSPIVVDLTSAYRTITTIGEGAQ